MPKGHDNYSSMSVKDDNGSLADGRYTTSNANSFSGRGGHGYSGSSNSHSSRNDRSDVYNPNNIDLNKWNGKSRDCHGNPQIDISQSDSMKAYRKANGIESPMKENVSKHYSATKAPTSVDSGKGSSQETVLSYREPEPVQASGGGWFNNLVDSLVNWDKPINDYVNSICSKDASPEQQKECNKARGDASKIILLLAAPDDDTHPLVDPLVETGKLIIDREVERANRKIDEETKATPFKGKGASGSFTPGYMAMRKVSPPNSPKTPVGYRRISPPPSPTKSTLTEQIDYRNRHMFDDGCRLM